MPGPALATAGVWVVGAIGDDLDPNFDFQPTQMITINLANNHTRYVNASGDGSVAKVLKTIVQADGSIAWTACAINQDPPDTRTGPGSPCWMPGQTTWVYALAAGAHHRRLLDHGNQITGHSLSLSGGRLTWINAGQQRSAPTRAVP